MIFSKSTDTGALRDFLAKVRADRLEREEAASRYYNYDFHNDQPQVGRFAWISYTPVVDASRNLFKSVPSSLTASPVNAETDLELTEAAPAVEDAQRSSPALVPIKKGLIKLAKNFKSRSKGRRVGSRMRLYKGSQRRV